MYYCLRSISDIWPEIEKSYIGVPISFMSLALYLNSPIQCTSLQSSPVYRVEFVHLHSFTEQKEPCLQFVLVQAEFGNLHSFPLKCLWHLHNSRMVLFPADFCSQTPSFLHCTIIGSQNTKR